MGFEDLQSQLSRRTFVKLAGAGVVFAGMGGSLVACSAEKKEEATEKHNPHEITIALPAGAEPDAGFDPLVAWGCGEHVHEPLIQSTLVTTTTELGFKNDLATNYSFSEDGLTWVFDIRQDVKFTNGDPLTARDVAFTLNSIAKGEQSEADLSMLDKAEATQDYQCTLHLNKPFNALLYTLAVIGIVPEKAYSKDYGNKPIGSGRYMLEQWDKGQQAILVANPDYYGDKPNITKMVVLFMEEDAALAAANAGKVDMAFTTATYAKQQPKGYDLLNCKTVDSRGISFPMTPAGTTREDDGKQYPCGNNVTADRALRQAMNYGVDRQRVIDNALNGYGSVAYSVGDGMPWSSPDMKVEMDKDKAVKLLEDGGWKKDADGVRVKDGVRAEFDLYYASHDSVRQAIALDFADQMKEFGIKIDVKGLSWDDLRPHEFSDPVVWGWGSNAPTEIYYLNYSSGWGNFANYINQDTDKYLETALAQNKLEDSYEWWRKAQWDGHQGPAPQGEATWVWFANIDHLYFTREGLNIAEQKVHPHGHGWSIVNNVDKWSWNN